MKGFYKLIFFGFLFFGTIGLFAQTGQGKLAGKVTDAVTGEALIGANVIIMNSDMGTATDINGDYYILNITPGTYNVKFSYVGYGSKTIQDVRVVAGITYDLDIELQPGIEIDEIVVTDTKLFEENATNTVKVVDSDQIARLPVKGVTNVVALQSGVVTQEGSGGQDGNATINVRGGRGSEVLYIIDGVPQNNVLNNQSRAQVSDYAIEQVSFQVGGYEAKYGQAQSGIVNITTKSGSPTYSVFADVLTSTYTDDYGYNLYTANLGGPIIPGNTNHTFFLSGERGWMLDADPPAVQWEFPTIDTTYKYNPNNSAGIWRFSGKTQHSVGDFRFTFSGNVNFNKGRLTIGTYMKNNSDFFPEFKRDNYSFSFRTSQTVSASTFWNITAGFRKYFFEQQDPFFKDDFEKWGSVDALAAVGVDIPSYMADGNRINKDSIGVFFDYGRVNNLYSKNENDSYNLDLDFTSQISKHLFEFGGGINYNLVRNYDINPAALAGLPDTQTKQEKYESLQPTVFGYNLYGTEKTSLSDDEFAPKNPIFGYAYLQDRYELEDLVLNIGLRLDYFDTNEDILKDPSLPFAGGSDPENFDEGDFVEKDPEWKFSPRIGLGFPVTESTVFHAQYGKFIQVPALTDLYVGPYDLIDFLTMEPQYIQTGAIQSEETTQYDIGFRQAFGTSSALNITAFYKNIKGLVNRQMRFFQRAEGDEKLTYIAPINSDFGTTKGIALSLDANRVSYFSFSLQYTYQIAEGTGSSTNSSQTAVFRNLDNDAPKVIAPLDFDQRHTATLNVNMFVPEDEAGFLEMTNVNLLFSFSSGRPYTPLDYFDILSGNNGGPSTTGYVNSRYMSGNFRIDLRAEKAFEIVKKKIGK